MQFSSPEEANAAIEGLNGKRVMPPMKTFMQVKHADGEVPPLGEPKLFVGMIPYRATEEDVRTVFEPYGTPVEVTVLHKGSGQSQGVFSDALPGRCSFLSHPTCESIGWPLAGAGAGFVRFESRDQCDAAIEGLDGKYQMPGAPNPLTVRYAAAPKSKTAKQTNQQKLQQQQVAHPFTVSVPLQLQRLREGRLFAAWAVCWVVCLTQRLGGRFVVVATDSEVLTSGSA